jgi:hypothetical protein
MVQIVTMPDGSKNYFPDNVTQAQIEEALAPEIKSSTSQNSSHGGFLNNLGQSLKPSNLGKGALNDLADVEQGAIAAPAKFGQMVAQGVTSILPKSAQQSWPAKAINNFDWNKFTAPIGSGNNDTGAMISRGVGSALPYAAAAPTSILGQALAYGLQGASENKGNRLLGALIGSVSAGAPSVIAKGAEAIRPTNMFRSNLSPEQLRANVDAAGDTATNLGRVIDNPFLAKQYENVLSKVPLSGVSDNMQLAGDQVRGQANNIVKNALGTTDIEAIQGGQDEAAKGLLKNVFNTDSLERIDEQLDTHGQGLIQNFLGDIDPKDGPAATQIALNELFKNKDTQKKSLYKMADDAADKDENFNLDPKSFSSLASKNASSIADSNLLKSEPDVAALFKKLQNYKDNAVTETKNVGSIIDAQGNPLIDQTTKNYPTLEEAGLLKGKLNSYAKIASKSPDMGERAKAGVYGNLAGALRNDINSAIEKSGNQDLKSKYNAAEQFFAKQYAPFLDKDVYKYIKGNGTSDTIVKNFVKTGGDTDKAVTALKVSQLSPSIGRLLTGSYLSSSMDSTGHIAGDQIAKKIDALGPNQLDALAPNASDKQQLLDYSRKVELAKHFSKALNQDGSINHDKLAIANDNLIKSPSRMEQLIPDPKTQNQMKDFAKLQQKNNTFMPVIDKDGTVNPAGLSTLAKNLSKHISKYNSVLPDKSAQKQLEDYRRLQQMNNAGLNAMANPLTGNWAKDLIPAALLHVGGALLGGAGGSVGGPIGSAAGTLIGATTPGLAIRPFANMMASPEFRKKFVETMIQNQPKFHNPDIIRKSQILLQGLTNALQQGNGR